MSYAPRLPGTDGPWAPLLALGLFAGLAPSLIAQMSAIGECRSLIASQIETVGTVCVDIVDGRADVEIELSEGNLLMETRVAVAATLEGFPRAESGVPKLGLFPHSSTHLPPVASTSYQISLEGLELAGGRLLFSVHASMIDAQEVEHGAWVEGRRFREPGSPATYFVVEVPALWVGGLTAGVPVLSGLMGFYLRGSGSMVGPIGPAPYEVVAPQEPCCAPTSQVVDTLRGNEEADFLTGGDAADVLIGAGGDDVLRGLGGADVIQGGTGRDVLEGGEGEDILEGGEGDDDLRGGPERDFLFGDAGDDLLKGEDGPDVMDGGAGRDDLVGGDGDDTGDGGEGDDLLRGGGGDDLLDGSDGLDILIGGEGNDDLDGGDDADILQGGEGDDLIAGGDGDDEISGGVGNDLLHGGDGADVVRGGPGDDEISGGDGNDFLHGQVGDDILSGSGGGDQLIGGQGDDILLDDGTEEHGQTADILVGGPGADRLQGGRGDDRLDGGPGEDWLDGGLHTDYVSGGAGDDVVIVVAGDVDDGRTEVIEGGAGADTLLLEGFGPADISEMVESQRAVSDSTPGPELSFALTDPVSGGGYRVSQIEVIRYVTRVALADGWEDGTRLAVLNPSAETVAALEVDFVAEDGLSLISEPEDSVAEWLPYTVAPLAVTEIDGRGLAFSGAASVRLRSNTPVAVVLLGELGEFGDLGFSTGSRHSVSQFPITIDRATGTTTALLVHTHGDERKVRVSLHPEDGGELDSREVTIPAGGGTVVDISELFPGLDTFTGSTQVWGGPLHGSAIQIGPGDAGATTLPMISVWSERRTEGPFYFPGAVTGESETVLTLISLVTVVGVPPDLQSPVGRAALLNEEGAPVPITVDGSGGLDSLVFALSASATPRYPISADEETASLVVQLDSGAVAPLVRQDFVGGGAVMRAPAKVGRSMMAPIPRSSGTSREIRLALQSVAESVEALLVLRSMDGQEVPEGSVTLRLAAGGSVATTLGKLFPYVEAADFSGSVSLSGTGPIAFSVSYLDRASGTGFELPVVKTSGSR